MKKALFIVGLLALLVACQPAQPQTMQKAPESALQEAMEKSGLQNSDTQAEMEKEMEATMEAGLHGGDISKYYEWDKAKFDQAVAEGKTVVLDFAANWCGVCQAEHPELIAGFEALDDPNVVGFRVHYNDDQTTAEHKALIKQYQIAYQHTKVVVKNGKVVLKSPESWTKDRLLAELRKLA